MAWIISRGKLQNVIKILKKLYSNTEVFFLVPKVVEQCNSDCKLCRLRKVVQPEEVQQPKTTLSLGMVR